MAGPMLDTKQSETLPELAIERWDSRQLDAEGVAALVAFFDLLARWDEQQNADAKKPPQDSPSKIRP
ncbi:MAG TPA: hypothetical protein VKB26_08240 [Candidatus Acidoferrales bacterium]|nr:hypothetical protein [Candidatus Acidoferrales bacterium]